MSGQWELVVKGKQGKGGEQPRKLTKSQKNKFVQNAPKVEDILPLAQIKTLYTALDNNNKENRKPSGKENSTKENENKKAQKKPQPEKKKEVKEKPVIPKSLESAAKSIDVKELINEVRIGQARFQDAPNIWLKGIAEYLNVKLDHTNPKANDYPLSALSVEVRDALKKALNEAGEVPVQHFFHICLEAMANDMSRGTTAIFGYKVMLQLMAFQSPSITVSNIPKLCVILNSYQNRQNIGHAILWAVAQGGVKDTQVGLEAWLKVMAPLIELKNYTSFVVSILNNILLHSPEKKPVPEEHFFGVLDVIHSSTVNLPNNKKQEFQTLSTALKVRTLKVEPEKHLRSFFEPLFQRLHRYGTSFLREELLECLVTCLSKDQNCFSVWRQLYTKHIPESTVLLRYIDTHWNDIKTKIAVKKLKETLSTFQVTNNEELRKGKHKHEQQLKSSQQLCEDLLKKMTVSKSFPWKLASFLVLTGIAGLFAYDVQKHGSFQASSTRHFLNDVGALEYFEQAWARTKFYSNKSYRWAEANAPYYYKIASEYSKPYLQLAWDISLLVGHQLESMYHNTRSYVEQKTPVVVEWVNQYAPGLVDTVKTHSVQAWGVVKQGALFTWDNILQNSYSGLQWLKTNVFVGSLSPESLQKYSLEALNTTQVYAVWTYDWVCQKVQTLSKIQ